MTSITAIHQGTDLGDMLRAIVADHGASVVAEFYEALLQDEQAQQFLSHSVVHSRLSVTMLSWLEELLGAEDIRQTPAIQERQAVVGSVHARIKIPVHLVMRGALLMKARLSQLVAMQGLSVAETVEAIQLINARVDTAIMLMSQAYVKDTKARARLDEAYRLFSFDQDVAVEKEAQKASLMDWSQKCLFGLLRRQNNDRLDRLTDSPFGLWIRHRAEFMFEHSEGLAHLLSEVRKIDQDLLPALERSADAFANTETLASLQACVDQIAYLVSELFQTLAALENGRDPLTRALNRRFLPAILGREVTFSIKNSTPLTVILLDIDHFKAINDQYGHQTGDQVLRQAAQVIIENVRPSDFVFRYGGEEFLIIMGESDVEHAKTAADRIRTELMAQQFETGSAERLSVTVSCGIALHTGHPDQNYLIKAADEALYRAKANGRNRIEVAP